MARDSVEQIHATLRARIISGELSPGAMLNQVELAEQLGVSRTPLREAVRLLQADGLLSGSLNQRMRVAPLSAADMEQIAIMRAALECQAIRLSVPCMRPEDFAALGGRLSEMDYFAERDDRARWTVPHRAFHRGLTEPAGEEINRTLDGLWDRGLRYFHVSMREQADTWNAEGHRELLAACETHDAALASRLLAEHMARNNLPVFAALDPGYEPSGFLQALRDQGARVAQASGRDAA
jgi:DNA-binding GntR family transcriptional regulator